MSTTTIVRSAETSMMSHRKQPVRQARVNTVRTGSGARALGGSGASSGVAGGLPPTGNESPPGFFPGITHFTDSIAALPKDMIRHFTMLKEVDAKIGRPEEALRRTVADILQKPVPRASNAADLSIARVVSRNDPHKAYDTTPLTAASLVEAGREEQEGGNNGASGVSSGEQPVDQQYDRERREQAAQIIMLLRTMLVTMDEKTHVLTTANDELDRHLARCESSWPQIEREISEITRLGNPNHRALDNEVAPEKKPSAVGERPRREAAMSNAHAAAAALAGEGVVGSSRKNRGAAAAHLHDSDFDEPRAGKGKAKNKRIEPPTSGGVGLGIANGTTSASNKRRKVEKNGASGAVGSQPMDRSNTSGYGASRNGGAASPSVAGAENTKKRARGGAGAMSAAIGGRKRAGTANSTSNSPAMASSPVMGNFAANSRTGGGASPALGAAMQRSGSTRARQNSTATSQPRNAPTSAAKDVNGAYITGATSGVLTATSTPDVAPSGKNGDHKTVKAEDGTTPDATANLPPPPPPRSSGRADRGSAKTEERHRPPSISTGTRNNGRASKTSTPVAASFPDSANSRPRSGRSTAGVPSGAGAASQTTGADAPSAATGGTAAGGGAAVAPKRSHKKGAGLAAQQHKAALEAAVAKAAAARAAADDTGSVVEGDEEEDGENEPRYCYCEGVSYGEMVACDWRGCQREWFHLDCAGLSKAPGKEKWYCRDCAPKVPKLR